MLLIKTTFFLNLLKQGVYKIIVMIWYSVEMYESKLGIGVISVYDGRC